MTGTLKVLNPLNSKFVMDGDRDRASSSASNYRNRRYDDNEPDPGQLRGKEGDKRDRRTEDPKNSRTKTSRSKSPNNRWDDPMKLFSEVRLESIHSVFY